MPDSPSFVASLNHELRNPLNAIVGMTDLTLLTPLSGEQTQFLSIIKSAAESLERILNEVSQYHELERLAGGPFRNEAMAYSVRQVAVDAERRWQSLAAEAGVPLKLRIADEVPEAASGYPQRLAQLCDCLIGHSLKHTQQGEIELAVNVAETNSRPPALQIIMRDTGHPVEPENLARLFVPFSKVRRAADRTHGAVLSLPIAALIVRSLGGEIRAHTPVAGGLAIECTVPTGDCEREAVACANS